MIKLQEYTPEVYYKQSRDFQYIGRLYDLMLNYVKTNSDLLYNLPLSQNSDDQFMDLMALTLGFKIKHRYTAKHLRAICAAFAEILKNKGNIKSLIIACNAIFNAEGIDEEVTYEITNSEGITYSNPDYKFKNNTEHLILYVPQQLKDTTLLTDLLTYLLPAGMSCTIIKVIQKNVDSMTKIDIKNEIVIFDHGDVAPLSHNDKLYLYSNNKMARIPLYVEVGETDRNIGLVKTGDAIKALADDTQGILANSTIFIPGEKEK